MRLLNALGLSLAAAGAGVAIGSPVDGIYWDPSAQVADAGVAALPPVTPPTPVLPPAMPAQQYPAPVPTDANIAVAAAAAVTDTQPSTPAGVGVITNAAIGAAVPGADIQQPQPTTATPTIVPAIVGGNGVTAAQMVNYRWMVSLRYGSDPLGSGDHICGGQLISPGVVLTAGHCGVYHVFACACSGMMGVCRIASQRHCMHRELRQVAENKPYCVNESCVLKPSSRALATLS